MRKAVFFISPLLLAMLFSFRLQKTPLKYLPLGDSYTICTGAGEKDSWPLLLAKHLSEKGIRTELLANPARNGFSTQNLIDHELPLVKKLKPDFVTLLIGVNDWVRGVDKEKFTKNLIYILDEVQKNLSDKNKILLITIPDFGVTPQGKNYSGGRDISAGISEFNAVIKKEAEKRKLKLVDIFEVSKGMKDHPDLVAEDGLHPSAKEYAIWEKMILEESLNLLK
jgi:acyl-CoA thioesterase I